MGSSNDPQHYILAANDCVKYIHVSKSPCGQYKKL